MRDLRTWKDVRKFDGHTTKVHFVTLTPADERGVTRTSKSAARVWNLEVGKEQSLCCQTAKWWLVDVVWRAIASDNIKHIIFVDFKGIYLSGISRHTKKRKRRGKKMLGP